MEIVYFYDEISVKEVEIMANLTISIDDADKQCIAEFCNQVGMTVSGLYNVFTKQVLREGRIPFEIAVDRASARALKEGDRIANDPKAKSVTVEALMQEMKAW